MSEVLDHVQFLCRRDLESGLQSGRAEPVPPAGLGGVVGVTPENRESL